MKQGQDTYKEVRVFEYPNAIVRVHIPDLTPEERARRMKRIHDAAAALLLERIRLDRERSMKDGNIRTAGADGAHSVAGGGV